MWCGVCAECQHEAEQVIKKFAELEAELESLAIQLEASEERCKIVEAHALNVEAQLAQSQQQCQSLQSSYDLLKSQVCVVWCCLLERVASQFSCSCCYFWCQLLHVLLFAARCSSGSVCGEGLECAKVESVVLTTAVQPASLALDMLTKHSFLSCPHSLTSSAP